MRCARLHPCNRLGCRETGRTNVDTQMGYGIGNNLFDIRYLTDENANLKHEGWASMADPFYDGKTILYKDYSGELDDVVFNNSAFDTRPLCKQYRR
ncbi:hypothetical protein NXX82_22615 [Bacteroides fragilis]|nr:hypothetical protein [Bacteroides fragilis]